MLSKCPLKDVNEDGTTRAGFRESWIFCSTTPLENICCRISSGNKKRRQIKLMDKGFSSRERVVLRRQGVETNEQSRVQPTIP